MNCTPKTFLCKYSLTRGVIVYAIFFLTLAIMCIIALAVEMVGFSDCKYLDEYQANCLSRLLSSGYAFSITAMIYCIILLIFQVWIIFFVKKGKASVVLCWTVVTSIWLVLVFILFLVLLLMFANNNNAFVWVICAVLGIMAFGIAAYGVALGFGLWKEIKSNQPT